MTRQHVTLPSEYADMFRAFLSKQQFGLIWTEKIVDKSITFSLVTGNDHALNDMMLQVRWWRHDLGMGDS